MSGNQFYCVDKCILLLSKTERAALIKALTAAVALSRFAVDSRRVTLSRILEKTKQARIL